MEIEFCYAFLLALQFLQFLLNPIIGQFGLKVVMSAVVYVYLSVPSAVFQTLEASIERRPTSRSRSQQAPGSGCNYKDKSDKIDCGIL